MGPTEYREAERQFVNGPRAKGRKPRHPRNAWYWLRHGLDEPTPNWLAAAVKDRDGWVCLRCGESDRTKLRADHIYPRTAGGATKKRNLQTLCAYCNGYKSDELVYTFRPRLKSTTTALSL
jgi:5-methylcytosine-specific restriction endonuclease McrA